MLPPCYGDVWGSAGTDPRARLAILPTQYRWLQQWAVGDFVPDGTPAPRPWEELSAAEQVRLLDRGVLDETLGGPFHPGAEFTWPMRNKMLYEAPFRIKRRVAAEPDYGDKPLDAAVALAVGGPLDGANAGDVTRWMAVPWQADSASCLSAYAPWVDDYLPTFWPARVPNDVLSEEQYAVVMDREKPLAEREQALAFDQRLKWLRGIRYPLKPAPGMAYQDQPSMNKFIRDWEMVGIVEARPGPGGALPDELWVETGRRLVDDQPPEVQTVPIQDT
jgi:L-lysine epsilon oxidase C-terminal domain